MGGAVAVEHRGDHSRREFIFFTHPGAIAHGAGRPSRELRRSLTNETGVHEDRVLRTTRLLVNIRGRVQNVGFRDRVVDVAESYRVAGTVRNLREGSAVEIDVEGEPDEVERFLDDVFAHLPLFARVEHVERETVEPCGHSGFRRESTR
jgi:acylphosphatase